MQKIGSLDIGCRIGKTANVAREMRHEGLWHFAVDAGLAVSFLTRTRQELIFDSLLYATC
jgi:hypothetical protein